MFTPNPPQRLLPISLLLLTTFTPTFALNTPHLFPRQASPSLLTCNQDNQLRALERFSTAASTFCPTYLAITTENAALPTYLSGFYDADISSACTCFQAHATNTAIVLTLGPSSTPATSIQAATPTASSIPLATVNSTQKGGLSAGAKAGIGIACTVVGVAIILGAAFFLRQKRRRNEPSTPLRHLGISQSGDDGGVAELPPAYDAVEKDAGGNDHEVEGGGRFELRGDKTGGGR